MLYRSEADGGRTKGRLFWEFGVFFVILFDLC